MKKNSYIYLLICLLIPFVANAQNDKASIYKSIVDKYGSIKSISLKFKSTDNLKVEGSIKAKKGNKYILAVGGRYIYCNGKKVWNYSPKDKNVLKNSYTDSPGQISIDKIFFNYLTGLEPSELKEEKTSKGEKNWVLTLTPKPGDKKTKNVKFLKLWISAKSLNINKLQASVDNSNQTWIVSDLKLNPSAQDKIFEFKVPKGVELIETPE